MNPLAPWNSRPPTHDPPDPRYRRRCGSPRGGLLRAWHGRPRGRLRPLGDPRPASPPAGPAGRLPDAGCAERGPLRRQGAQPEEARRLLRAAHGAHGADRADDLRHRLDDVPDHEHRDRGAPPRTEPHQAAQAAVQRAAAGRQVLPQHPYRRRPRLSRHRQAPRRPARPGPLLRPLRLRRRREPHAQPAPEGVPAPHLHGLGLRIPHPPLPPPPDQALLRPLRRTHRRGRLRRHHRRRRPLPRRPQHRRPEVPCPGHATGLRSHGVRARRRPARPHPRADPGAGRPRHQSRDGGRGRRRRPPPRRRPGLRAGVLLPRAPELGQPRLLPPHRLRRRTRGAAGGLPRPVLLHQGAAEAHPPLRPRGGPRTAGRGPDRPPRPQGRDLRPRPGREAHAGRTRPPQREGKPRPQARRNPPPSTPCWRASRTPSPSTPPPPGSRSTTTPTSRAPTRSAR